MAKAVGRPKRNIVAQEGAETQDYKLVLANAVPELLGTLMLLASKRNKSPKVRLDAAKTLLGMAGVVAPKAATARGADRSLHELDLAELQAMRDQLDNEVAGRAKVIVQAPPLPVPAPAPQDIADLID